ncbi:MAG: DinB family protein [Salinimicrobium sp.]
MKTNERLKETLSGHLQGGKAFMPVEEMLKKMRFDKLGVLPNHLPYSFYMLFYHMWFTQKDILNYCLQKDYSAPVWPTDYWPNKKSPENEEEWKGLQTAFFEDREALSNLLISSELSDYVPSNERHIIFREILLVIEHSAYHSGQLLIILRQLGLHS